MRLSNVVDKINKTVKKHVHNISHGTSSRGPYLKISVTEKAVVCRYAAIWSCHALHMSTRVQE